MEGVGKTRRGKRRDVVYLARPQTHSTVSFELGRVMALADYKCCYYYFIEYGYCEDGQRGVGVGAF